MLRAAVFRQLKRLPHRAAASPAFASHAASVQVPVSGFVDVDCAGSRRFFATNGKQDTTTSPSRGRGFTINGIPLKTLAKTPTPALIEEFGSVKVAKAIKTMPYLLAKLCEQTVTSERPFAPLLEQIFYAADKCNATWIMKKALATLEKIQPRMHSRVSKYETLYRALERSNDDKTLLAVFEDFKARPQFQQPPLPELIYRFGIVAKFRAGDVAAVEEIVREMRQYNVAMTTDLWSQLMLGFAKAGHDERALKILQILLNEDVTSLDETEMNRVIVALGLVGKPQLAFEFYSECQIPLSASVFDALLSVCVCTDAGKEGIAILQNRKRFGLVLDTKGYMRVLEAMEKFDLGEDIFSVLEEMKSHNVGFGPKIEEIIARNQDHLAGTPFTLLGTNKAGGDAADAAEETQAIVASLRNALASDNLETATRIADLLVRIASTQRKDEDAKRLTALGATTVEPAEAADLVIDAYVRANHRHKIAGLARGFQLITIPEGDKAHSSLAQGLAQLLRVAVDAEDWEQAHAVLTTSLKHAFLSAAMANVLPSIAEQATRVLFETRDSSSALKLVDVLLDQYGQRREPQPAVLHNVLYHVLSLLVREKQLKYAFAVLGNAQNYGVELAEPLYARMATTMFKKNHTDLTEGDAVATYSALDVQNLWEDCRQRGIPITKTLISASSGLLARGDQAQRALLWSAYHETTGDAVTFPAHVFQDLLEVATQDYSSAEALAVYDAAVATATATNGTVSSELLKTLIDKLVSENLVDEAFERLESSTVKPPSSAFVVTMLAIVDADCSDSRVLRILERMRQLHNRGVSLPMATTLLESANQQRRGVSAEFAWAVVQSFELRKVASGTIDWRSWKNEFKKPRNLESGQKLYAMAYKACKDSADFAGPLERRIEELEGIKQQWIAKRSEKPALSVARPGSSGLNNE